MPRKKKSPPPLLSTAPSQPPRKLGQGRIIRLLIHVPPQGTSPVSIWRVNNLQCRSVFMWDGSQPPDFFSLTASSRLAGQRGPRGPTGRSRRPRSTQAPSSTVAPREAGTLPPRRPQGWAGSQGSHVSFQSQEGLKGPFLFSAYFSETSQKGFTWPRGQGRGLRPGVRGRMVKTW